MALFFTGVLTEKKLSSSVKTVKLCSQRLPTAQQAKGGAAVGGARPSATELKEPNQAPRPQRFAFLIFFAADDGKEDEDRSYNQPAENRF